MYVSAARTIFFVRGQPCVSSLFVQIMCCKKGRTSRKKIQKRSNINTADNLYDTTIILCSFVSSST